VAAGGGSGLAFMGARQPVLDMVGFIGQATIAFGRLLRGRARFRRSDLLLLIQQAGADALGIVTLISFLVGTILAFVGAAQLQQFRAAIYVADLVGIAMVREMGAMMTAIVIAGPRPCTSVISSATHELASIFAIATNSVFLDVETRTMTDLGPPKELLQSGSAGVRRFLSRGEGNGGGKSDR
jgi:ABC-type transporter Mla maintaining outer membrane lipid asymmetry permease subunit MlaE